MIVPTPEFSMITQRFAAEHHAWHSTWTTPSAPDPTNVNTAVLEAADCRQPFHIQVSYSVVPGEIATTVEEQCSWPRWNTRLRLWVSPVVALGSFFFWAKSTRSGDLSLRDMRRRMIFFGIACGLLGFIWAFDTFILIRAYFFCSSFKSTVYVQTVCTFGKWTVMGVVDSLALTLATSVFRVSRQTFKEIQVSAAETKATA